jgi:hypothetical protein
MTSGSDKVEQSMYTVVAEAGVTLDTRLLCENIVVLPLEIANNFTEAFIWLVTFEAVSQPMSSLPCLVINLVSKTWCIYDGQGDASSFFIQFQLCKISACVSSRVS